MVAPCERDDLIAAYDTVGPFAELGRPLEILSALTTKEWAHHDALMRTTLTLDPDVARMIADEAHRRRKPLKQVVNDALRRGLAPRAGGARPPRYRVRPHAAGLRPGLDRGKLNALADDLEARALVAKLRPRGAR